VKSIFYASLVHHRVSFKLFRKVLLPFELKRLLNSIFKGFILNERTILLYGSQFKLFNLIRSSSLDVLRSISSVLKDSSLRESFLLYLVRGDLIFIVNILLTDKHKIIEFLR